MRLVEHAPVRVAYLRVVAPLLDGNLERGCARLWRWAERHADSPRLFGLSRDDPEVTPMGKYRYDFAVPHEGDLPTGGEIGATTIEGGLYACLAIEGDVTTMQARYDALFRGWLPRSGYQPTHAPALEVYRSNPLELGWDRFDFEARVPVSKI